MRHIVITSLPEDERASRLRELLADRCVALTQLNPEHIRRDADALLRSVDVFIMDVTRLSEEPSALAERLLSGHPHLRIVALGECAHADLCLPARSSAETIVGAIEQTLKSNASQEVALGSLHEESVAVLEEGSRRLDFVTRLDEEVAHLSLLAEDVARGTHSGQVLARTARPVLDAARDHGLDDVARTLSGLIAQASSGQAFAEMAPAILETLRAQVRAAQLNTPTTTLSSESQSRALTVVVIDEDQDYLRRISGFADQFMIPVRTATSVAEAASKVQTPLLAGVILTPGDSDSQKSLSESIATLQKASGLPHLPLALVSDVSGILDRVQGLWAGASHVAPRPVSAVSFSQIARRLTTLRRSLQASVMVVDPRGDFAARVAEHLGDRDMAIQYLPDTRTIFDALEHHRPDLVLLSSELTGMDATDVCRSLRAVASWREIPIVLFAPRCDAATRIAAYRAGADDVIGTSISPDELTVRLSVRLERARQAAERSDRDLLTGLLTRRPFLEQLAARLSEVTRRQRRLVFAILDVDHFKAVNDRHGHLVGDRVLATLGRLLQDRFRIEDLRARWGGEEFVVVLVDEGLETSALALRRVLDEFSAMIFEGEQDTTFSVSFSAGLAAFPNDGQEAETLFSVADARLLRAKKNGRSRIEMGRTRPPIA
ncbi:diguanylate cyclase [Bradymonadaceae bacterium TMQ3]|nr:diguanylate cyclase [Bradymonadaceae bacterium TMQ3]TXC77282.1 diguanylate cyclase [Bradymonadales bacterium TMQ1]